MKKTEMHQIYWFLCFCFPWALNYAAVENSYAALNTITETSKSNVIKDFEVFKRPKLLDERQKLVFTVMPLSSSSILILWNPNAVSFDRILSMTFNYQAIDDDGKPISKKEELYDTNLYGERKVDGLNESTQYRVTLEEDRNFFEYTVDVKTYPKTDTKPAKPDFRYEFIFDPWPGPILRVWWLPCGSERNCSGKEAGSYFSVKYKFLYTDQEFKTDILRGTDAYIDLFAGRLYKLLVTSVNGNMTTDSDIQEIFLMPAFSPVQMVKVISLNSSTALISWKPPKNSSNMLRYYEFLYTSLNRTNNSAQFNFRTGRHWEKAEGSTYVFPNRTVIKLSNLNAEDTYVFSILPVGEKSIGYEYHGDFRIEPNNLTLPLATPDFEIDVGHTWKEDERVVIIKWLPCGQTFDCKNTRPGLNFIVDIKIHVTLYFEKFKHDVEKIIETDASYHKTILKRNQTYDITVQSVMNSELSESSTKIFSCP